MVEVGETPLEACARGRGGLGTQTWRNTHTTVRNGPMVEQGVGDQPINRKTVENLCPKSH
eukprot:SAG11_NODE_7746_length_1101_cov_1.564870_2_plen_59_part_01